MQKQESEFSPPLCSIEIGFLHPKEILPLSNEDILAMQEQLHGHLITYAYWLSIGYLKGYTITHIKTGDNALIFRLEKAQIARTE